MRASKEEAERARQNFAWLSSELAGAFPEDSKIAKRIVELSTQVAMFLNLAKRKLPTEAAYQKDCKRRAK